MYVDAVTGLLSFSSRVASSAQNCSGGVSNVICDLSEPADAMSLADGAWHQGVVTFDRGTVRFFRDGVLSSTGRTDEQIGGGARRYGFVGDGSEASTYNGDRNRHYFTGDIASLRMHIGWAMDANDVAEAYQAR